MSWSSKALLTLPETITCRDNTQIDWIKLQHRRYESGRANIQNDVSVKPLFRLPARDNISKQICNANRCSPSYINTVSSTQSPRVCWRHKSRFWGNPSATCHHPTGLSAHLRIRKLLRSFHTPTQMTESLFGTHGSALSHDLHLVMKKMQKACVSSDVSFKSTTNHKAVSKLIITNQKAGSIVKRANLLPSVCQSKTPCCLQETTPNPRDQQEHTNKISYRSISRVGSMFVFLHLINVCAQSSHFLKRLIKCILVINCLFIPLTDSRGRMPLSGA